MATGHSWRHGWIPLSPAAIKSKNHGGGKKLTSKKPTPGKGDLASRAVNPDARLSDADLGELAKTPAGRRALRQRQRAIDDRTASPAKGAAAAAGFTGPPKRHKKSSLTKKPAAPKRRKP